MQEEYTAGFADCYVLTSERSAVLLKNFLDHFVPDRAESASEYWLPEHSSDPTFVFQKAEQLIEHLIADPHSEHRIYWTNIRQEHIQGAMCFFTEEGRLIVGLYTLSHYPDTTIEDEVLGRMKAFCNSNAGYIDYENPPELITETFEHRCR